MGKTPTTFGQPEGNAASLFFGLPAAALIAFIGLAGFKGSVPVSVKSFYLAVATSVATITVGYAFNSPRVTAVGILILAALIGIGVWVVAHGS